MTWSCPVNRRGKGILKDSRGKIGRYKMRERPRMRWIDYVEYYLRRIGEGTWRREAEDRRECSAELKEGKVLIRL